MKRVCLLILFVLVSRNALANDQNNTLQLTLPPTIYAVPGVETSLYFDNIVLTQTPEDYRFQVDCPLGTTHAQRWMVTPTAEDVGQKTLQITVSDRDGQQLATASTQLQIVPRDAGAGEKRRLLIIGDSLTHATIYPNELHRLLSQDENPKVTFLGTHKPERANEGVAHEGYGGWTWQRFATKYEPNPDGTYRKRSSPFVYLGEDKKPILDVARFFREECDNDPPDFVIVMLGINDCFSAPPDDSQGIDDRIDLVFAQAETLLTAIQKAAPQAKIGICLTTPPNSRQAAFEANYQDRYTRWGWKRIQHHLVQRQLEQFGRQQDRNRFLIPTELDLDPVDGYPANNGVHPNETGYHQIARTMYAWLKWRLSENQSSTKGTP
ncbi:MAG: SGNH/GDSL hydrolase family protein [Planctomycetaceae bacterium]|nr:SGNH/GDSL hydrolase family protein [Planctomycetaceae bacterium]